MVTIKFLILDEPNYIQQSSYYIYWYFNFLTMYHMLIKDFETN